MRTKSVYIPNDKEISEYKSGIPPTINSLLYKKVSQMTDDEVKMNEKKYYDFLQDMDENTMAYEICFHKWWFLRHHGELRSFWGFVPKPERSLI